MAMIKYSSAATHQTNSSNWGKVKTAAIRNEDEEKKLKERSAAKSSK